MTTIRTEPDGTVTAIWAGHEIKDARRGFSLSPWPDEWKRKEPQPVNLARLPIRGTETRHAR